MLVKAIIGGFLFFTSGTNVLTGDGERALICMASRLYNFCKFSISDNLDQQNWLLSDLAYFITYQIFRHNIFTFFCDEHALNLYLLVIARDFLIFVLVF